MKHFANDGGLSSYYKRHRAGVKTLIKEKLKVLREFYIVDDKNEDEMRVYLEQSIANHPNNDPRMVLDQAASTLIKKKLMDI